MSEIQCPRCGSEDVYFSKKKKLYVCEDCEHQFILEKKEKARKIFFSYAHDENEWLVTQIRQDLEKQGYDIWIDRSEIKSGDNWRQSIMDGLLQCSGAVFFLSRQSVRPSGVCLDELHIALTVRHGNIRTVLLEDEDQVIPPSSVSSIQWLDMSRWKQKKTSGPEGWDSWYGQKISELERIIEKSDFASFTGEIDQIHSILGVQTLDAKERLLISRPFTGRKWLEERLEQWRWNPDSSRIFLLYGRPGMGKSSFAANQLHYNPHVICGFFCEWDKESQKNPQYIIRSLAFKICTRLPDYRRLLLSRMKARNRDSMELLSASELFEQLLVQPLSELIDGGRDRQIIILDGLDEASAEDQNELAEILVENAAKLPRWIGLLITSRPEGSIKRAFQRYEPFECSPANRKNQEDIRTYLELQLGEELSQYPDRESILRNILKNCEGNFLYASMFVEAVRQKNVDVGNISSYPKGLDAIHFQNFKRKFRSSGSYKTPRRILEVLAASDSMPVDLLCRTAEVDFYDFLEFREKMGSILVKTKEKVGIRQEECKSYSFCHKSIQDWITDSEKSSIFYVDPRNGLRRMAAYFQKHMRKETLDDSRTQGLQDHMEAYMQRNLMDCWSRLGDWRAMEDFLLLEDTPLYPYWKCLNRFPLSWDRTELVERLWNNKACTAFFNRMQRLGERKYVSDIQELFRNRYGIQAFDKEMFETYVDIVHLGGDYREAVALYREYLSEYSPEEIYASPMLLHYRIRMIHHQMFFAPVGDLIEDALSLFSHMDPDRSPKDYNEMLFLLGGNLGVLSGDFRFAGEWLKKAEDYAARIGDRDFQIRAARKKADLLCMEGEPEKALKLIGRYVTLDSPVRSRYEIYLLGTLGETYRQMGELFKAFQAFEKLLKITKLKGLTGWQCHACLGLANTGASSGRGNRKDVAAYLSQAQDIYRKSDQAWGVINAEIVEYRLIKRHGALDSEILERIRKTRDTAAGLQYRYETGILDALLEGVPVKQDRLLFL